MTKIRTFLLLSFVGLFDFLPVQAAVQTSHSIFRFDSKGGFASTQTITADNDQRMFENSVDGAEIISRPDLRKQWIIDKAKKRYREFDIAAASSVVVSSSVAGDCLVQENHEIIASTTPMTMMGYECRINNVALNWICLDKDTKQEVRRFQYRAKIWTVGNGSFPGSYDDINPSARFDGHSFNVKSRPVKNPKDVTHDVFEVASEMEQFSVYRAWWVGTLPKPFIRSDSSTVIIEDKEIPFEKQQSAAIREETGDQPVAGSGLPALVAFSAVFGIRHGLAALKKKDPIPPWVLDIDPQFADHGGEAESIEITSSKNVDDPGLFEVPAGFKKVDKF